MAEARAAQDHTAAQPGVAMVLPALVAMGVIRETVPVLQN